MTYVICHRSSCPFCVHGKTKKKCLELSHTKRFQPISNRERISVNQWTGGRERGKETEVLLFVLFPGQCANMNLGVDLLMKQWRKVCICYAVEIRHQKPLSRINNSPLSCWVKQKNHQLYWSPIFQMNTLGCSNRLLRKKKAPKVSIFKQWSPLIRFSQTVTLKPRQVHCKGHNFSLTCTGTVLLFVIIVFYLSHIPSTTEDSYVLNINTYNAVLTKAGSYFEKYHQK